MALKRDISATSLAAFEGTVFPVLLFEVDWEGGAQRVHTGVGPMSWDGKTWVGAGDVVGLEVPAEARGIVNSEFTIPLTGRLEDIFADQATFQPNRTVIIWVGVTTQPGGNVLSGDPFILATGVTAYDQVAQPGVDLIAESEGPVFKIVSSTGPSARASAELYHTDESHQAAQPGDTIFEKVRHARKRVADPQTWPQS